MEIDGGLKWRAAREPREHQMCKKATASPVFSRNAASFSPSLTPYLYTKVETTLQTLFAPIKQIFVRSPGPLVVQIIKYTQVCGVCYMCPQKPSLVPPLHNYINDRLVDSRLFRALVSHASAKSSAPNDSLSPLG